MPMPVPFVRTLIYSLVVAPLGATVYFLNNGTDAYSQILRVSGFGVMLIGVAAFGAALGGIAIDQEMRKRFTQ